MSHFTSTYPNIYKPKNINFHFQTDHRNITSPDKKNRQQKSVLRPLKYSHIVTYSSLARNSTCQFTPSLSNVIHFFFKVVSLAFNLYYFPWNKDGFIFIFHSCVVKLSLKSIFFGWKMKKIIFCTYTMLKKWQRSRKHEKKIDFPGRDSNPVCPDKTWLDAGLDVLVFLGNGGTSEMCSFNI